MTHNINDYDIVADHGHYVVFIDGKFFCTVDNQMEAAKEVEDYYAERR
jgi:hypothetical protein